MCTYLNGLAPLLFVVHIVKAIDAVAIAAEFSICKTVTVPIRTTHSVQEQLTTQIKCLKVLQIVLQLHAALIPESLVEDARERSDYSLASSRLIGSPLC